MKTKFILTAIVLIIVLMISACTKKSETAVIITAESYAKILNGDLSDFAGTWENVYNEKRHLKADGFFTDGLTVSDFKKTDNGNGAYSWWIKIDEDERLGEMGEVIFLYPAGVELDIEGFSLEYSGEMGVLLNDKTKDRIVVRPVPLYEALFYTAVYYREGQAPTAETLAAQRQTTASSNPHPEILNGDLSEFAGTWASSSGIGVILRPDGIFAAASNMHYWKEAGGFSRGVDLLSGSWASNGIDYHWNIYDEEGRYRGIVLFPVGVGVRYGGVDYPSDTTRTRIYSYQHDAYPANEYLYYRVDEAASQSKVREPAELTGEWHSRSITGSCHGQEHYIFTADGYYRKGDIYQKHDGTWSLVRDAAAGKYHLTLQYKQFIDFESGWTPNDFTAYGEYETIDPNNIDLLLPGTGWIELTRCHNPGWNAQ